jgi:hypothetical protein
LKSALWFCTVIHVIYRHLYVPKCMGPFSEYISITHDVTPKSTLRELIHNFNNDIPCVEDM